MRYENFRIKIQESSYGICTCSRNNKNQADIKQIVKTSAITFLYPCVSVYRCTYINNQERQ